MGNTQESKVLYELDLFDESIFSTLQIACAGGLDRNSELRTSGYEDIPNGGLREFQNKLREYNIFYNTVKGEIEEIQQIKESFKGLIDCIKINALDPNKKIDETIEEQYLYIILYLINWSMMNEGSIGGVEDKDLRFSNYVPGVIINDTSELPIVLREKYIALKSLLENLPEFLERLYDLGMKMVSNVVISRDVIRRDLFNIAEKNSEVSIKDFGYTEVRFAKNFETISRFAIELEELFRSCKACLQKANRIIRICCEKVDDLKRVVDDFEKIDYDNPPQEFKNNVAKFIRDKLNRF
ncbi:hypothetical protein SteCoe_7030 [Stentor coeruleus]|uniref:Uncharacterized protein n=1 Tax=Stentor coeruleus TaxID=5963 RepID=A0A1R2CNU6_9CILI|nr:hypothetical protein SteCoe_7030 [Stentor coeruleus]